MEVKKMEKLKEKYASTRQLLQDSKDYYQSLQDEQKTMDQQVKEIDFKSNEFKHYVEKSKELQEKLSKNTLLNDILTNNLISIQQDLSEIALNYFKENYKSKRLGQKTIEKYQNEVKELINKNYNIDVYCYLRQKETYNNTAEYAIYIQFKDYYYINALNSEKVIYNITNDEEYLYYYNKIEYIDTNNIDKYINELYQKLTNYSEELDIFEKELNKKIDTYNSLCVGALSYKRYQHIYLKQG